MDEWIHGWVGGYVGSYYVPNGDRLAGKLID